MVTLLVHGSMFLCILLVGCTTCRDIPGFFVNGRMTAGIDGDGVLIEKPKAKATRTITLAKPGEVFSVDTNEIFELNIPAALDMGRYSLSITPSDDQAVVGGSGAMFDIAIEKNCAPRVRINRSCQKINWYNPYVLPEVYIDNPKDEQLIYTPLYNPDTVIVGYEIRLGDHAPCGSKAREVWTKLRAADARSGKPVQVRRKPIAASSKDKPIDISKLVKIQLK
jgi:hypothetical protein